MSSDWQEISLIKALDVNPAVNMLKGDVYPFVDMQSIEARNKYVVASQEREFKSSGSRFIDGDTLMARITPCLENGKISRYRSVDGNPAHGSTEFIVLRHRKGVTHPEFVYYLTISDQVKPYAIAQMTGSSGRQRVPVNSFKHLTINLPPLHEQQAISEILKTLDGKIELNRQMCETLEKTASTLFKSWFVDFDPVKAKMEGHIPEGMEPELLDLFPDSFEDSDLGAIPRGWEVSKIDDVSKVVDYVANGSFASLKENVTLYDEPEYALYVRTTDSNNGFIWNNLKFTDEKSYKFLKKSVLKGRETIISNVGDVGSIFRPPVWFDYPMTLGSNAVAITENRGFDGYLYWFFKSNIGQQLIASITTGSAQLKFNKTSLRGSKILIPQREVLQAYELIEKTIWEKLVLLKSQIVNLSNMRDNLLPKLISGELRVENMEAV